MKTTKCFILLAAFAMCSFFTSAQTPKEPSYFIVETMKATAGKGAEYVKAEKEVWKKLHQERLKQGLITGWFFYAVRYPAGTSVAYDYVTVTRVSGMKKVENPWGDMLASGAEKLLTKEQFAIANTTGTLRNLTTHSLSVGVDFVAADPKVTTPAKYVMINYMKVKEGMQEEYVAMESKLVKPMHVEMMKSGGRAAWGIYGLVMPSGDNQPFDYTTSDFYNKWEDITGGSASYRTTLEKVHPGMSTEFFSKRIEESRRLVNRELWELLDYVQ